MIAYFAQEGTYIRDCEIVVEPADNTSVKLRALTAQLPMLSLP